MTPEQFAYWLNGFVELGKGAAPTAEQWKSIREHLDTVFKKVTPPVADSIKTQPESALERSLREFAERQGKYAPQQTQPSYPNQPYQPYWIGTGTTFPINPSVITC